MYLHVVGTPQSADMLVYSDPCAPAAVSHRQHSTEDERFAVLTISERGKGKKGNALLVRDFTRRRGRVHTARSRDHRRQLRGHRQYRRAAAGRDQSERAQRSAWWLIDPADPAEAKWRTIVPEAPEPIGAPRPLEARCSSGYLKDASTRAYVHAPRWHAPAGDCPSGHRHRERVRRRARRHVHLSTRSARYDVPPTIYRYNISTATSTVFRSPEDQGLRRVALRDDAGLLHEP